MFATRSPTGCALSAETTCARRSWLSRGQPWRTHACVSRESAIADIGRDLSAPRLGDHRAHRRCKRTSQRNAQLRFFASWLLQARNVVCPTGTSKKEHLRLLRLMLPLGRGPRSCRLPNDLRSTLLRWNKSRCSKLPRKGSGDAARCLVANANIERMASVSRSNRRGRKARPQGDCASLADYAGISPIRTREVSGDPLAGRMASAASPARPYRQKAGPV